MKSLQDVRRELTKKLRHPLSERIWSLLEYEGYVEEYIGGHSDIDYLYEKYCDYEKILAETSARTKDAINKREIPPDKRTEALSSIVFTEAGRHPEVESFRQEILQGNPISPGSIESWIQEQAKRDGPVDGWVSVEDPISKIREWEKETPELPMEVDWRIRSRPDLLKYYVPGDVGWRSIPIKPGGILGRLKKVVSWLTITYPVWKEEDATAFVLTGMKPRIARGRVVTMKQHSFPALSRIQLTLDPRLSVQKVSEIYGKVRREFWGGQLRRDKPMKDKNLELAVFAAINCRGGDASTWEDLLRKWNSQHKGNKEWTYSVADRWNFSRDVKKAWERVTGKTLNK